MSCCIAEKPQRGVYNKLLTLYSYSHSNPKNTHSLDLWWGCWKPCLKILLCNHPALANLTGSQAIQKSPHKPGEQASWNDTSQNKGYLKATTEDRHPWSIQQSTMQQADQAERNKGAQEIGPRSLEHEFLQRSTRTPKLTFSMFKD